MNGLADCAFLASYMLHRCDVTIHGSLRSEA